MSVVDCWIGVVREVDRLVVRLAGRLSIAEVPDLLATCQDRPLELDLTELVSADPAGIEALQRVRREGVTLVGVPGYIQLTLDAPTGRPTLVPPPKGRH